MSKKRPSQAEACWRPNQRYRRMYAFWKAEEACGDPLGWVAEMRKSGALARIIHRDADGIGGWRVMGACLGGA